MIIESNGISIERLREKDIELVRKWRNSRFVKQFMIHQETITSEMQKKWFKSVDNFNNFYFIIHYKGVKVGVGNINSVNWDEKSAEAGVFVNKQSFIGSVLPVVGALTLSDIVFKVFKLDRIIAQVRADNPRSKKLNKLMGSKLVEGEEGKEVQLYHLTKDSFYKATRKFLLLLKPMGFSTDRMKISFDNYDIETGLAEKMIKLIETADIKFEKTETENAIVFNQKQ